MAKLRQELKEKEEEIISCIEKGDLRKEFSPKILKVAQKAKILSTRLNLDYRILFRRGRHGWLYYTTIHRKELDRVSKKL